MTRFPKGITVRRQIYFGENSALKWLTYTEKYVEMPQMLRFERGNRRIRSWNRNQLKILGRVQIVSKVEAQGSDRCFVSYANAHRVRSVIIALVVELRTL